MKKIVARRNTVFSKKLQCLINEKIMSKIDRQVSSRNLSNSYSYFQFSGYQNVSNLSFKLLVLFKTSKVPWFVSSCYHYKFELVDFANSLIA